LAVEGGAAAPEVVTITSSASFTARHGVSPPNVDAEFSLHPTFQPFRRFRQPHERPLKSVIVYATHPIVCPPVHALRLVGKRRQYVSHLRPNARVLASLIIDYGLVDDERPAMGQA
jgi:hypothetical protein